ncbi:MAG: Non-specific serine/threonine protein kinase, partial [Pseudomonadota bacterium]|nr:Non-specific serine/threonine protein kinase [Pseudomonadota bacterium]
VVTPGYSPIEQYVTVGDDYGPWTDIYALGAVMYRCITGAPPIEAPGRVLKDPVQPAVEVGAGLYSRGLLQVVDQALAVRPEERFQSVVAMQQAINAAEHSGNHADFFQLPPIQDSLLDLPSATPSLRFEAIPPSAHAEGPGRSTTALPAEQPAMNWMLDQVEPHSPAGAMSPGGLSPLQITDSDLSLPMLENIWENLDESAPPAYRVESAPPFEPAPEAAPPAEEPSASLLKRSPQSALEHLKKVNTRRTAAESRSSPRPLTRSEESDTPSSKRNKLESPPESVPAAMNTRSTRQSINWTQVLLAVIAISGLSGVSLLSYEYYQVLQEQRQQEAAALQRQQEEAEAQRAQEATRQREAEFIRHIEQARKAITDRVWDRADRALNQAAALDSQNPALAAARTELLAAQNSRSAIKTRTDALTGLELHWIEGGCFNMGSPPSERDRSSDESVHEVCVKGFWIGKTEVTNQQFRRFKSTHDSGSVQGRSLNGDLQPAVNLNWEDAQAFAEWLTWETGADQRFRLPTEAEWEYAARAGATTRYYWGNDIDPRYANFSDRNDPTGASVGNLDDGQSVTAPVGTYLPNTFGLRDTAGNVWEWTCSEYLPHYGSEEQRCSAKRPNEGQRTVRGGSWNNGPGELRSAKRLPRKPGDRNALTGFRVVMAE